MRRILWLTVGLAIILLPSWWLMRKAPPGEVHHRTLATRAAERALLLAVRAAAAGAECGYASEGGYRYDDAESAARRIVETLNAASRPVPGEPAAPGPMIRYVLDRATAPWQVVVRADTDNRVLVVEGYGAGLERPLHRATAPCDVSGAPATRDGI